MLDGESMADHTLKTKMQIILCDHTPSECQDSIICHIRSSQDAKKRADVDCRLGDIAVVLDNAIKSKFKACRCGLQARMHCSRSVGAPQKATAEIKCSV